MLAGCRSAVTADGPVETKPTKSDSFTTSSRRMAKSFALFSRSEAPKPKSSTSDTNHPAFLCVPGGAQSGQQQCNRDTTRLVGPYNTSVGSFRRSSRDISRLRRLHTRHRQSPAALCSPLVVQVSCLRPERTTPPTRALQKGRISTRSTFNGPRKICCRSKQAPSTRRSIGLRPMTGSPRPGKSRRRASVPGTTESRLWGGSSWRASSRNGTHSPAPWVYF